MRHSFAWLGAAALVVLGLSGGEVHAQGLKPYVVFVLDTSGSMDTSTGSGPPTCGGVDSRLNHAKCAINEIANSYGDMVFALGRFRETPTGTYSTSCSGDCSMNGIDCSACDCNGRTTACGCAANLQSDARLEMLTGLVDGTNQDAATWTDFTCNTCGSTITSNPEIFETGSWTPNTGALKGAKRYWQGLQATDGSTIWPAASAGFNPIATDPLKLEYLTGNGSAAGDQQCRPYIVIQLTDGDETCGGNAPAAAASMLDTVADGRHYRIETKPIGFGIAAGDADIEAIAHSGGNVGDGNGGANEGYYATNQTDLALAISSILAGTIRSETCDGADNDCDNQVDEDFPSLGTACDDGLLGICRGTGVYVCSGDHTTTTCQITNPGATPTAEVCNNIDDNCNGLIDEGLMCGGCGDAETCNNLDDDCDGATDEDLTRPCGTDLGQCTAGTETCDMGVWVGCTATGPFPEICDGIDNDCDGICDGFSQACTNLPAPGNPGIGPCHEGIQTCNSVCSATGNSFGPCLDEVGPQTEVCNCVDDDCDGTPDDGTGGANCDSSCGVGTTVCDATTCALRCDSTIVTGPEIVCNGLDDNCNGDIDENYVSVACDGGGTICNGHTVCTMGNEICVGTTIGPPQCNCADNDCDGNSDESSCGGGSTCVSCQCAYPCDGTEFSCPVGKTCVGGFCLINNCADVVCPPDGNGNATVCIPDPAPATTHTCQPACDHLQNPCPDGTACAPSTGQCVYDDCRSCATLPGRCCAADQLCQVDNGVATCVADPCATVNCPTDQYCLGGTCLTSCGDVECPDGQRCRLGVCEPDPCGGPCPTGHVCDDATGTCIVNPCNGQSCPDEACDPQTGECIADPCNGVTCPGNDLCVLGTCYDPSMFQPDAEGPEQHVTTGGGGGCSTGGGGAGAGVLVALLALASRRRRGGRS